MTDTQHITAKEYLQQVKNIDYQLKNIEDEVRQLQSEIITVRSAWPDGQPHGTGTSDPVGNTASKLADKLGALEQKHNDMMLKLWIKRAEIVRTLSEMPHAEYKRLLYLRYVKLQMWEQIAVDMHYTYQWVAGSLHSNALEELQQILDRN